MNIARLKELLSEYGPVAAYTYFGIFFLVLVGFILALSQGIELASLDRNGVTSAGLVGTAYIATKLTQPIRIAATLVLTPVVAAIWRRTRRGRAGPVAPNAQEPAPSTPQADH